MSTGPQASTVVEIADWASHLQIADVPERVLDLCRAQRRSVLAAVAAASSDDAALRVLTATGQWAADGPAPLLGTSRRVRVEDAVYGGAALSVALDFDDYVCFGHTGHSAVLVPVLMAAETGTDGDGQLVAQVIANEVEARLGGAVLLGPMNGQLWAFIHAAGAALAAGRLLGLDATGLAHALAIALAHPLRATVPGFMAPDSKLLVAAEPTAAGVRAARLAAAGVTGPLDALDDERGALPALSFAPIRGVFEGLGEGWATDTLSIKPYPGCAYVDTTVDALLQLDLGVVEPDDVEEVVVEAGILTTGMDALSAPYAAIEPPTPVTVTFSIPWNVAIVLRAGRLSEEETNGEWLAAHQGELAALRHKVRLRQAADLTAHSAAAFTDLLPAGALVGEVGMRRLVSAALAVRAEHPATGLGLGDLVGVVREGRRAGGPSLADLRHRRRWWDPTALERFRMTFPSRVTVRFRDGSTRRAQVEVPRGGAGNTVVSPADAARAKFAASGPRLWGEGGAAAIDRAIDADDPKLYDLLGASPGEDR